MKQVPFIICLLFAFSFINVGAGDVNLTISDSIHCLENSTLSTSQPPDLSDVWAKNTTETCLYVTIQDRFSDGWANSTKLFYWAQVREEESNIISVGLDCENCGGVKAGCITPLDLEEELEHYFHFTLVSIDNDNSLDVPEYFWEMEWSIQIVRGDDWREKYYGGFNTSMVFSYNREIDDLSLAWSENLWQYPPSQLTCDSVSSENSAVDSFHGLVYGSFGPNYQSFSYGFSTSPYFSQLYTIAALPDLSLERFGLLSCLSSDDPTGSLYKGSFALRASKPIYNESDLDWHFCGFTGQGAEELGFALSKNGKCSGQYVGSVEKFCSGLVSSFPTLTPTSAPTISEASSFFESFDSSTLLENAPALQGENRNNRAVFSYYVNTEADFDSVNRAWESFIANYLVTSFDVEYYSFTVWTSYLKLGSSTPVEWSHSCSNKKVSNDLLSLIPSDEESSVVVECNYVNYMSSEHELCIGCSGDDDFSEKCSAVEKEMVHIPSETRCDANTTMSKHAVVVEMFLQEAVEATVPVLSSLIVVAEKQYITVTANISTTSTGGQLYCRAFDSVDATPSRASIKSQGTSSSIPPAEENQLISRDLVLSNLFESTNYSVYCFTEDSIGNQMSDNEIKDFGVVATTKCCRNISFTDTSPVVLFGTDEFGNAPSPSVFSFALPIFPSNSLIVTPIFYDQVEGGAVGSITATKSSFVFDASTTRLGKSRSFVVEPTVKGSYFVKLALSGDPVDMSRYSSSIASFDAKEVGGALPAPSISYARFSDGGGKATLVFNVATDYGLGELDYDPSTFWDCGTLLSFEGDGYTACTWLSDSEISLVICGNDLCAGVKDRKSLPLLVPSDVVEVKEGILRAKCKSSDELSCAQNNATKAPLSTPLLPPLNPLTPSVFLAASNPGGECNSDLILDATASEGAGGRAWESFQWSVKVDGGEINNDTVTSAANIESILNDASDISLPIEIPYSYLYPVRYAIYLSITNFLGATSFTSVHVDLMSQSSGSSKPSVLIDGSSYRRVKSYEPLELSVSVDLPSCISGNNASYNWAVYRDITYQPSIVSQSVNPKEMKLSPYTLEPGFSYRVQVTATLENGASDKATFRVDVVEGSVYVKIKGAGKVFLPLNSDWTLDASDSVIEDVSPFDPDKSWSPSLAWTCSVASSNVAGLAYGDDCSNILNEDVSHPLVSTTLIPLRSELLLSGGKYLVTASTYSDSGSYVSDSVEIEVGYESAEQAAVVSITSSFRKFNPDRILQLFGTVTSPTIVTDDSENITTSWGVYDKYGSQLDVSLSEILSTPVTRSKTVRSIADSPESTVSLSLSAIPNSFAPGVEYVFRLSAEVDGIVSYASIALVANAPPRSGKLEVLPSLGIARSTRFSWSTFYWTDDPEDMPLKYTFKFVKKSTDSSSFSQSIVGLSSEKAYMKSYLPSGRASAGNVVVCSVSASDFYEAESETSTEVVVDPETQVDISFTNFSASITESVLDKDWNGVAQDVGNAVALISDSDCQYAPDCGSLHRQDCGTPTPPHTCGKCVEGFEGLAGPSNVECLGLNAEGNGEVNSDCESSSDCRYDRCDNGKCTYPEKTCPSANALECSGRGVCEFYNEATSKQLVDSSGNLLPCLANDTSCSSRCVCDDGSFGKACSLDEFEYRNRSMTRELICDSLLQLSLQKDPSYELAGFLTHSAAASFDPSEVISSSGISTCLHLLESLVNISNSGYFLNEQLVSSNATGESSTSISVQENFAIFVSSFVDTLAYLRACENCSTTDAEDLAVDVENGVNMAVSSLSSAINSNMVPGEKSLTVVTGGVRMSVRYDAFEDLEGALLSPPMTEEEEQYGSALSTMILPSSGLASCSGGSSSDSAEQYYRLSVMQFGGNPYAASNSTWSTNTTNSTMGTNDTSTGPELMSRILRFTPMVSSDSDEATGESSASAEPYTLVLQYSTAQNWTLGEPGCGQFEEGSVGECPCDVESYDATSVTLKCYNLLDFCPLVQSSRRALRPAHGGDKYHPHFRVTSMSLQRRRLDFDYGGAADDDAAPSGSVLDYGAMFVNLGDEFTGTLSSNPFTSLKSLKEAMPVIFMMSVLCFVVVVGYAIMARWDRYDKIYLTYVMNTTKDKRYKPPSLVNLKNAFMEKSFVSQKRKSMLNFDSLGSKLRDRRAQDSVNPHEAHEKTESFFEDVYSSHVDGVEDVTLKKEAYVPSLSAIKEHLYNEADTAEKVHEAARMDKMGHKIATFFDTALPPTSLLAKSNGWTRFMKACLRHHDWLRVFTYSSIRLPRTIRFLIVWTDVLILLFVDSIFFGVLFPDDGTCTAYDNTSMEECESAPSKFVSGASLCFWDEETSLCALRPPPTSLQFYMVVAIIVTTFSIGPQAICHYVLEEVCALTPVFSEKSKRPKSAVASGGASDSDSDSETPSLALDVLEEKWQAAKDTYLFNDGLDTKKLYQRYAYYDFTTVEEETNMILRFVTTTLENRMASTPIPWRRDRKPVNGLSAANLEAIMSQLGIHSDGSPVELSWFKRVVCRRTPRSRLMAKIRRVRRGVDIIMGDIDNFSEGMEEHQETALIQHFILEQLTPFKRYALKRQFFEFDCGKPDEISGLNYVMGWSFICLVWMFCIYWIFAWAVANSGVTMTSWSYEIGFVLLQDTFVNDMVQVVIVNVIAIEALRPQLKRIYAILNGILKEKISVREKGDSEKAESTSEESESWHFCVAQHMSSACRAARRPSIHYLPFSQLLMRITDYDIAQCRDERGIYLNGFVVAVLVVPTLLALSHEVVQDMFLDVLLPTAWSCFCIANAYALMLGPWALIVPYCLLVMAAVYRQVVVVPRIRKRNLERAYDVEGYKYTTREELLWQNMNRQLKLVHMNTLNLADYDPLRVHRDGTSAVCAPPPGGAVSGRERARSIGEESVISELSAPADHCSEHSDPAGKEEVSLGELSGETLNPVALPEEIVSMKNTSARDKFISSSGKPASLGMSAVSKMLFLARQSQNQPQDVSSLESTDDPRAVLGPLGPGRARRGSEPRSEEVLAALNYDSRKDITSDLSSRDLFSNTAADTPATQTSPKKHILRSKSLGKDQNYFELDSNASNSTP